ncbi:hypothetical protein EVAR_40913_1 [Eumeta japonica]|uniref:Uncharacterized protein n=1 Tax=Eumeta variegata TaxID=151549 RepID=A0A4C1X7W0_EUMVA|nr:hypothetical protein EVAR_40913_1 [Eumeta japonica]
MLHQVTIVAFTCRGRLPVAVHYLKCNIRSMSPRYLTAIKAVRHRNHCLRCIKKCLVDDPNRDLGDLDFAFDSIPIKLSQNNEYTFTENKHTTATSFYCESYAVPLALLIPTSVLVAISIVDPYCP